MAVSLGRVFELQQRIFSDACFAYFGRELSHQTFNDFSVDVKNVIAPKLPHGVFVHCILDLCGRTLDTELAERLSWRLAGNYDRIRKGIPVPPWPSVVKECWSLFSVTRIVQRIRSRKAAASETAGRDADGFVRTRGWEAKLRALTGLPAGERFDVFWSSNACDAIKTSFGFSRYNRAGYRRHVTKRQEVPFLSPAEFYGMRVLGRVVASTRRDELVKIESFAPSAAAVSYNRGLTKMRSRDEFACPMGFDEQVPCHTCHVGADGCRAACHARTYVLGDCACGGRGVTFDPDSGVCLRCQHRM